MKCVVASLMFLMSSGIFSQEGFFVEAHAALEPIGVLFHEEPLASNGFDAGALFGLPLGRDSWGIAASMAYRSFGTSETLNGALFWARGGLFYRFLLWDDQIMGIEAGGGWHRGAWTGVAGTFTQSEAMAYTRLETTFNLGILDFLARMEGSAFFVPVPILQPSVEIGARMDLVLGWSVAALLKGGFWSHPRDPEAISNAPLTALRLEARWRVDLGGKPEEPPSSELGNQFDQASVGDALSVDTILFLPNSADLDQVSLPVLEDIRLFLERRPSVGLEIQGFANPVGRPAAERLLSQQRAETVLKWFVDRGVAEVRLRAVGKGGEASGGNAQANRRVVFVILAQESNP